MFMQDDTALERAQTERGPGHERVTLRDGRAVCVRPVRPRDAVAEQAFVAALSPQARYRRFHMGLSELPAPLAHSFTHVDQCAHVALVAEAGDGIVADARYVCDSTGRTGEFAIAVADAWQGLGLGRLLIQRLAARARRARLRWLRGSVLSDNEPMLAVMRHLGARLSADPKDPALYRACLAL
jgi:GNAT superfamily N-acetyltransferase